MLPEFNSRNCQDNAFAGNPHLPRKCDGGESREMPRYRVITVTDIPQLTIYLSMSSQGRARVRSRLDLQVSWTAQECTVYCFSNDLPLSASASLARRGVSA